MAIRLTDQGALAVALAQARAAAAGRAPTVVDLLVGLAEEPDGVAGRYLAERVTAVVALAHHPPTPRSAPLEVAVRWAAAGAGRRPAGTGDLLAAALEVGGSELADVLEAVGLSKSALQPPVEPASGWKDPRWGRLLEVWGEAGRPGPASETHGLRPPTDPDPGLTTPAALAVARSRAVAGGAVDLLIAVASSSQPDGGDAGDGPWDPVQVIAAVVALHERGEPERAGEDWDRGLETAVAAAHAWRAGGRVTTADLVRAAVVAGGVGPGAVLEELERRGAP